MRKLPIAQSCPAYPFTSANLLIAYSIHLVDIETCSECGGDVRIIACIEDPLVISKILTYLDDKAVAVGTARLPQCRAPPATGLFVFKFSLSMPP